MIPRSEYPRPQFVRNAWTNGLYTCYYMLNMGKEFEEIEKIVNM